MEDLELEEQAEALLREAQLVQNLGFISMESFARFREEAVFGLMRFGDEFLNGIGVALKFADLKDAARLVQIWRNEISQHQMLEQIFQAQQKAKKEAKECQESGVS